MQSQFEKRVERSSDEILAQKNNLKNFAKRFGELKIMRTFAAPFEKRVYKKFIEKTDYCTRSKYRENTIYREALISLEIRSVRDKLRIYIYYTMKSLILAQDER